MGWSRVGWFTSSWLQPGAAADRWGGTSARRRGGGVGGGLGGRSRRKGLKVRWGGMDRDRDGFII